MRYFSRMMHILGTHIGFPPAVISAQPMISLSLKTNAQTQIAVTHPAGEKPGRYSQAQFL